MKRNIKILLCDDDDGILEVLRVILEENGYIVQTLTNGKGIEKKVKEYKPDLIFLDIWMPGIDGQEITKILKHGPETKKIPIILISALNEVDKIRILSGADDFLSKPFEIKDLLAKVEKNTFKKTLPA